MGQATRKVAISMPVALYRAVERVRKTARKTRSAVLQDALRYWLDHQAEAALIQEYAAAVRLLSTEEW